MNEETDNWSNLWMEKQRNGEMEGKMEKWRNGWIERHRNGETNGETKIWAQCYKTFFVRQLRTL